MKHTCTAIVLCLSLFCSCLNSPQVQNENYLSFADSRELCEFFRYDTAAPVIIQGHRGTMENGLPENSIAAMEYVLSQMPAIFEIDPRLTKDSVIVLMHDSTLDRTTNGTGKVSDYTWEELRQLNLKNAAGELTEYKIPTLSEVFEWARGKTILMLDKKDVPFPMIADIIRKHQANSFVHTLVRSPEDALFYYSEDPGRLLSLSFRKPEAFAEYLEAGIPPSQIFVSVGTQVNENSIEICRMMREIGVRCIMSASSTYDKLETAEERAEAYRKVIASGVTIMESNYPVEAAKALSLIKAD